jgi:hypothetical protein
VGTGAIFLKLYNGIVVGQQGEGFVAGKENITQSQSPADQDISPLLPPLSIQSCATKILEPTAPCFKKRNRNPKQQPHPHLERTKTTQT